MNDFLVTSTRGMFLVEGGVSRKVKHGSCFGLTWDREGLYVGDTFGGQGHIRAWTPSFERGEVLFAPVHDVHQILWQGDALYVTNTANHTMDILENGVVRSVEWREPGDNIHLNSVWFDGTLFWIVEHRRGVMPFRIRAFNSKWEKVRLEEFYGLENDMFWGLHNVYIEDDVLYSLSTHYLVMRHLETGETTKIEFGGYLRGLARKDGYWYIGKSRLSKRQMRNEGNGSVLILDDDLDILQEIMIPDCGQVHEVRLLEDDLAHNGLPFPGGL